jgi:hypothetical protein
MRALALALLLAACGSTAPVAPLDAGRDAGSGGSGGAAGSGGSAGSGGEDGPDDGGSFDAGAEDSGGSGGGLKVMYTCRSTGSATIVFSISVVNDGSAPLALGDVKLRYWYYTDPLFQPDQMMSCNDTDAGVGCPNVTSAFTVLDPMQGTANEYVEIGFLPGAGSVDPSQASGDVSVAVYTGFQHQPMDQTDDYSFDCSVMGTPIVATKITAYLRGALVSGVEP